jgi:hypothetical protein
MELPEGVLFVLAEYDRLGHVRPAASGAEQA